MIYRLINVPILVVAFLLILFVISFKLIKQIERAHSLADAFESLWKVQSIVLSTLEFEEVVNQITNIILTELNYMKREYAIVVLALVDENKGVLKRIGISQTKEAETFLKRYPKPFRSIEIPLDEKRNIGVKVLYEGKVMITNTVADVLYPVVDPEFVSNLQREVGLRTSVVFPVVSRGKRLGVLIFSLKKDEKEISEIEWSIMKNFVGAVGIAVENSQLFQALKVSNSALGQANKKLQELDMLKDEFVSVASHELRTPMTAIKSYLWMAVYRGDQVLSEKMKRYLTRALLSTDRLINMVGDMLNVSRIEAGRIEINPAPCDLAALCKDVVEEIMPKAEERGIKLEVIYQEIPKVFTDADKVHQVMLNLIGNSLKFTPSGGSITISFFTDGKVVETSVKDTGAGIDKDDLSRLFKKFGKLANSYVAMATSGGTGLGLYICKSLIELMHGKIWAYSEGTGKGTTITFSLPVATVDVLQHQDVYKVEAKGEAKGLEPAAV